MLRCAKSLEAGKYPGNWQGLSILSGSGTGVGILSRLQVRSGCVPLRQGQVDGYDGVFPSMYDAYGFLRRILMNTKMKCIDQEKKMTTTKELRAIIEELELIDIGDAASYLGEELAIEEQASLSPVTALSLDDCSSMSDCGVYCK